MSSSRTDTIDFDKIDEHGPQTYSGTFEVPNEDLLRADVAGVGNVAIEVTVDKGDIPGEYVANGAATSTIDLACSRCVEPYPFANNSPFHVRFRPRLEISAENEEIEITDKEELDVEFYSERQIPLRDLAFEQLQLAIPMKPLCDEGCLGLCPTCGANRVREKCACEASMVDDRWGVLKGIRDELAKKNKDV
jgi:uncharacterized protein